MIPLRYGLRNLIARRATTAASVLAFALVVTVFSASQMLEAGIARALGAAGRDDVALVLRQGADVEIASVLPLAVANAVRARPEVARGPDGAPRAGGEVVVVATLERANATGLANVQVRGVAAGSSALSATTIRSGRAARLGAEAIVGRAIAGRFAQVDLGGSLSLGAGRDVSLVGVFDDPNSTIESEVIADLATVQEAFGRSGLLSSVRAQLSSPDGLDAFARGVREATPDVELEIVRETTYYARQTDGLASLVTVLGLVIAAVFSVGATLGCVVTAQAGVAQRRREIGTLRALGFSGRAIAFSFLLESIWVALLGGGLGVALALALAQKELSMVNTATWSEIVFRLDATPQIIGRAVAFAVLMGLTAGLSPAIRAARVAPIEALRDD